MHSAISLPLGPRLECVRTAPSCLVPASQASSCSEYDKRRDYPYPQSVEADIVRALGAVFGPYTGTCFASARETAIEHIIAASEAHDSGLCAADADTRARFTAICGTSRSRLHG